jgi:cytochrome c-type biogenesis protein
LNSLNWNDFGAGKSSCCFIGSMDLPDTWRAFLRLCKTVLRRRMSVVGQLAIGPKPLAGTGHPKKEEEAYSKTMEVSIFAAFVAGLVSFLSPCVLPLVPGYISMLSGIGVEQLKQGQTPRGSLLASSSAFIAGFSIVFVTFGASATAVSSFLLRNKSLLAPIAGALVILFGLHLIGWLGKIPVRTGVVLGGVLIAAAVAIRLAPADAGRVLLPAQIASVSLIFLLGPGLSRWLNRDVHFRNLGGRPGIVSGFLMGFAFAFGWTPCIGPILAGVLAIAATRDTVAQGIFLLAMYSLGLAIPFFLTALGIGRFLKFYQRFRRHLHAVEVFSGILLLGVGGLIFVNRLTWLSGKLAFLNRFAW